MTGISAGIAAVVLAGSPLTLDDHHSTIVAGQDSLNVEMVANHGGGQGPGGDTAASPVRSLPACSAVTIGTECREVRICEPDPSMGTTHALHVYSGVDVHGWPYGVLAPCEPADAQADSLPALVLRAFQQVPLPAPVLDIQPPKGKTLIGLETIFSTTAPSFTRQLTLLGQQVELRIEASGFSWHHGDESSQTTTWSGIPWREGLSIDRYITHVYEQTGTVRPSVDVTWSAQYRVDNGPWQPVNGTVTRASAPQDLTIVEAEPRLMGS